MRLISLICDSFSLEQIIVVSSFAGYSGIADQEEYRYPQWAEAVGFLVAGSSVLCIPILAIKGLLTTKGTLRQVGVKQAISLSRMQNHT